MMTLRVLAPVVASSLVAAALCGCGLTAASDEELMGGSSGSGGSADAAVDSSAEGSADDAMDALPDADVEGDVNASDVVCFPPEKLCGDECVAESDPAFGCTQDGCDPCPTLDHAVVGCNNGECLVTGCDSDWGDCDGDPTTGCEASLRDVTNCGVCGAPCSVPHASTTCSTGTCTIEVCEEGWGDCNNNPADGCETNLRTLENCGECAKDCTVAPPAVPTCVTGECIVDGCDTETTGLADCDADQSNGCETDVRTTSNCGGCGIACAGDHVTMWECSGSGGTSTYACSASSCDAGWGNCDTQLGNGCETNIGVSVDNCGACGGVCSVSHVATRACVNGICVPTCSTGYADCDGPEPGSGDNGCETDTHTMANCGGCGVMCSLPHAIESCSTGVCTLTACDSGWGDCTSVPGCETDLRTTTNCGACGTPCDYPHATESCSTGTCAFGGCEAGWGDCTSAAGCETDLRTTTNCGTCGTPCDYPHATESCSTGTCTLTTCDTGWGNCTSAAGCETSIATSTSNCGACGRACSTMNVEGALQCTSGVCTTTACKPGWANLTHPAAPTPDDGCESGT